MKCLPASHYFTINRDDLGRGKFEPHPYWHPSPVDEMDDKHAIEAFRDLLSDSVRLRLRSDVPVGVTLSGGLDSSSVVCLAGEQKRMDGNNELLSAF